MSPDVVADVLPKSIALFVPSLAAFFCFRLSLMSRGWLGLASLMTGLMAMVSLAGIGPWALGNEPAPIPALLLALISVAYAGPLCRSAKGRRNGRNTSQSKPVAHTFITDMANAPPAPVAAFTSGRHASRPKREKSVPVFRHQAVSRPLSRATPGGELTAELVQEAERRSTAGARPVSVRLWFDEANVPVPAN